MGKRDELWGVGDSGTGKTTLQPKKASIAGRKDASRENPNPLPRQTTREVEGVMSTEYQVSSSPESTQEAMREPRVYKVEPVTGQSTTAKRDVSESPNQALNASYGRRWMQFQQHLREHRDKVVSGCELCGTQKKVA
jgi:hypothetical protein